MAACVIPFSARRPRARAATIEEIKAYAAQAWVDAAAPAWPGGSRPGFLDSCAAARPGEDEILQLLRRIDQRLAKLSAG